eukprot:369235_1
MAGSDVELHLAAATSDEGYGGGLPPPSPKEDSVSQSHDSSLSGTTDSSFKSEQSAGNVAVEYWASSHIKYWLSSIGLEHYYPLLIGQKWDDGEKLLAIEEAKLLVEAQIFFANVGSVSGDEVKQDVRRIVREIEKLQINEYEDVVDEVLSVDDIFEFERRLTSYSKKWERIAWIEEYVEDADGRLPTTEVLTEELDVPSTVATELLSAYSQKDKEEEIDLNKLFEGFDISDHGVIWWSIVLDKLQLQTQDSLWTILRFVLRELSTTVCIRLLEHFKFELSRFESIEIDRLCQAIVFGSLYPMCTAIRLSGYMHDAAERDLSRGDEFEHLASDYASLAIHLLKEYTESDHLAAILLEMPSDIDTSSAIELAVEYHVIEFVSDKRIERISSTLYRTWRFLHMTNKDESFKVRPLSATEIYDLVCKDSFYFTPLGQFIIETMLFVFYLTLFTWVTNDRLSIYVSLSVSEIIFWILNWGYIVYEIWDMISSQGGFAGYISDWTNQFDAVIALNFLVMMGIRGYMIVGHRYSQCLGLHDAVGFTSIPWAAIKLASDELDDTFSMEQCASFEFTHEGVTYVPGCLIGTGEEGSGVVMDECTLDNCCQDTELNTLFSCLWILAVMCLYLRVLHIMTMSKKIGPFVNMIINMLRNFANFFFILLIFWIGAILALVFIAGDTPQYTDWWMSTITTWRALLGEWPVVDVDHLVSAPRFHIINVLLVYWMMIGAIVLLNLLIALMAKTFDEIHEKNAQQVQFIQIERIYNLDERIAVMPPPLFLVVIVAFIIIKIIDVLFAVLFQYPLPMGLLQPKWLRREGKETNLSGTDRHIFDESRVNRALAKRKFDGCCGRCRRAYFVYNQQNQQRFDWVCKFCRQRTIIDYSSVLHSANHVSYSDLQTEQQLVQQRANSQNIDAVQRLGDRLGLDKEDIINVRRLQPKLCQRCYRHRKPITRPQMQLEFLSYWTFTLFIRWWFLLLLWLITTVISSGKSTLKLKQQLDKKVNTVIDSQCKYSQDVIKVLPGSKEMAKLFSDDEVIWYLVEKSRYELTPRTIRRIVDDQILQRAHDRDYELHEFYVKICGKNRFDHAQRTAKIKKKHKKKVADTIHWNDMKYCAKLWFKNILNNTRDSIHLSHTKLFPFSAKLIESHVESQLNEIEENGKFNFDHFNEEHLAQYLPLLYVKDTNEQQIVIDSIRTFGNDNPKFIGSKGKHACLWDHFIHFLYEVRKLIARVRRIENMIRDCEDAAKAHGNDAEIYLSQFHLVFEDIQNDAVATVIFRSIDQENKSIPYWKVRYFLIALKQMRRNVDRELLERSRYTQVSRAQFLDIVLRRVKARDDDSDDSDLSDDDKMRDDTETAKKEITGIRNEGDKIFTRIWVQNELKITLTQIREYMRSICKDFKNDDVIHFLKQRLSRQKKHDKVLTLELLKEIMTVKRHEYGKYNKQKVVGIRKFALFDEDDVPEIYSCRDIYNELQKVYSFSENPDKQELCVADAYNLIYIGQIMSERIQHEIKSRGHDLELTQDLFIKTMEKKVYSAVNYNVRSTFSDWSDVARHSASVFQQVHDEEQNKVTLGQVRETLHFIYRDISSLVSISKFKKKLNKKKKLDQMVDHHRFWKFLVEELNVVDDSEQFEYNLDEKDGEVSSSDSSSNSSSDEKHDEMITKMNTEEFAKRKRSASKRRKRKKKKQMTNYERSNRVFDLMENQNGLWITMRQIHVYLKWLTQKLQSIDFPWRDYENNQTRINDLIFKRAVLGAAYHSKQEAVPEHILAAGTLHGRLGTQIDANNVINFDDLKYDVADIKEEEEDLISEKELQRLQHIWGEEGHDMKLFSEQLSWIFKQCAMIDVATDDRASWHTVCKFTAGFRDGSIEERIRHDLKYLTGNHQVYRDEFEQFKATLKCRGDAAISLFYQIRHFAESINWSQIAEFLEFIEIMMINTEDAIDVQVMGEDEDPTVEELIPLMQIPSEVDGNWLFSIVLQRHSNKVSWVEIREYLIDWNETRDEVTEYFEELVEKRDREKLTEKTLDEITNKVNKIKSYFDENLNQTKDELTKKTRHELMQIIAKTQWQMKAQKSGASAYDDDDDDVIKRDKSISLMLSDGNSGGNHKAHKRSIDLTATNKSNKPRLSAKGFMSKIMK